MMSRLKSFMRATLTSLLVCGVIIPVWGQEPPTKDVPLKIAPLPELIDVWDTAKFRARRPLLIAHRGGVVGGGTPECSQLAVELAAAHRYGMVELDVMASKDHHPVVFHDEKMMDACGVDGQISDFPLEDVTQIRFLKSDQVVTSLDTMLGLCRSLNLGVMLDIQSLDGGDLFYNRVLSLIKKHRLDKACMSLGKSRVLRGHFEGKVLLTLTREMLGKVQPGKPVDLHGFFWFGVPRTWPMELIKPVQENGALVIPALNTFRYSKEHHRAEVREDAKRLLKAGVDGFQIDCIYQDNFGRANVWETR